MSAIAPANPDDPETGGADPVTRNRAALRRLFPCAFKDGRVDVTVLQALLGEVGGDGEEAYGLTWNGKRRAGRLALTPSSARLQPAPEDSETWATTRNLLIEGDNLEALKLLRQSHAETIAMIYIDPPYNTGEHFTFPDDYSGGAAGETSGSVHDAWLSMMYPRLILARSLLSRTGVIVSHIDEHELANMVHLLSSVFGEENEVGILVWDKRNPKGDARGLSYQHESILIWARDRKAFNATRGLVRRKANAAAILDHARALFDAKRPGEAKLKRINAQFAAWIKAQPFSAGEAAYNRIDENGDVYRPVSMAWPNKKRAPDDYFIPLQHPATRKACPVPARGWRNPPATMARLMSEGRIVFGLDHRTQPQRKYLLAENMEENLPSVLSYGGSDDALLAELGIAFDNPKPMRIARDLIAACADADGTVLDFFAGSGTAGHAVMAENVAHGANRRFILVQLPEPLDSANPRQRAAAQVCDDLLRPRNIAELTKARLRRGAAKLRAERPDTPADLGFRVYRLEPSGQTGAAEHDRRVEHPVAARTDLRQEPG